MRWYFAIDQSGACGITGEDAKTAVRSAIQLGGLDPYMLYFGDESEFTSWMRKHGVKVIINEPSFMDTIRRAEASGLYKSHSIGHWLRISIPMLEQDQNFVLYTDCDITFLKNVDWDIIRPKTFAAAPEFKKDNWNYFNSGVMVLNVPFMRATYAAFEERIRSRILDPNWPRYDDQIALNEAYQGYWERLDPLLNWKPYWGLNSDAALLHFHGPKLNVIEMIVSGSWPLENQDQIQLLSLVDGHIDSYCNWLQRLSENLQTTDFSLALRMQNAASGLLDRKRSVEDRSIDLSVLNYCMFI